jgi:hypothetical protein
MFNLGFVLGRLSRFLPAGIRPALLAKNVHVRQLQLAADHGMAAARRNHGGAGLVAMRVCRDTLLQRGDLQRYTHDRRSRPSRPKRKTGNAEMAAASRVAFIGAQGFCSRSRGTGDRERSERMARKQ